MYHYRVHGFILICALTFYFWEMFLFHFLVLQNTMFSYLFVRLRVPDMPIHGGDVGVDVLLAGRTGRTTVAGRREGSASRIRTGLSTKPHDSRCSF